MVIQFKAVTLTNCAEKNIEIVKHIVIGTLSCRDMHETLKAKNASRVAKVGTIIRPTALYPCKLWNLELKEMEKLKR